MDRDQERIGCQMSTSFSRRHGYAAENATITVREDAPHDLRYAVAEMARTAGMRPGGIRSIVCRVLLTAPDRNNWSEYPNIWQEVLDLLGSCEWYML
jgi:hypothetical protein